MSDVRNAAYALSIAMVFSTLILSFALVESSKNIGSVSGLVKPSGPVVQPTAVPTGAPTVAPTTAPTTRPPTQPPETLKPTVDLSKAPVQGSADAKVVLVEYTDLQCPFCSRHHEQSYAKIITDYVDTGKIRYYFKQFPLSSIHPDAENAGVGTQCALSQDNDKAVAYIDKVFVNQDDLSVAALKQYAKDVGLDSTQFDSCLDTQATKAEVDAHFQEGVSNGVSGTPSFLVLKPNGDAERIVGAQPYTSFKAALDRALAG